MATQSPFSFLNGLMERVMAGPQPPQWLVSEVHQRLVLFLNHVLMQEKEAMERLVRQKGRVARVQWRGYSMALQITPAGLFNVAPEGAQPDLLLEVTETSPLALAQVALRGDKPSDRKSTRLNSSHLVISYAVFCLKKKKQRCRAAGGVAGVS